MTQVLMPDPANMNLWEKMGATLESAEEIEQKEELNTGNEHLAILLLNLQFKIEQVKEGLIHKSLNDIQALQEQLKKFNEALDLLDAHLSNKNAKNFDVKGNQQMIDALLQAFPHPLLKKETWSREEVEAIRNTIARRSEYDNRSIPIKMMKVQELVEERHQIVKSAKELLTALIRSIDHFVNNQQARG